MSRSKSLSSWKAPSHTRSGTSSSIRGKISNPIPMTDDDEFPIRAPGTGIATPLGTEGLEKQLHIPSPITGSSTMIHNDTYNSELIGTAVTTNSDSDSSPVEYRAPTMESHTGYESTYMRDSLASQQTRSRGGSGSGNEAPSRKKSTLRSVVRRLFGRKRKSDASESRNMANEKRAGQHRSDPSALTRNFDSHTLTPKRSASLPINDFNGALSSHSPFQDHFSHHTERAGHAHSHEELPTGYRGRHRSATTSRLYSPHKSASYGDWTGLTPRPASQHVRGSKVYGEDEVDAIGYAITSGSNPHRRSRSLSHLRDAAQEQAERRRSDEIRYWRESYDVDPLSPAGSRPDFENQLDADAGQEEEQPQERPEPFNFCTLPSEMAGMKITKAVGLEERVSHMENRLLRIEKRLSHAPHRSSIVLQDVPRSRSGRGRSASGSKSQVNGSSNSVPSLTQRPSIDTNSTRTSAQSSMIEDLSPRPTFLTSPDHSPHPSTSHSNSNSNRLSSSTVTPSKRPPLQEIHPNAKPSHLNLEHYHTLLALITHEQSLRQRLETQVVALQSQVLDLQATSLAERKTKPHGAKGYPTPSPEIRTGRGSEHSSFDDSDDEGAFGEGVDDTDIGDIYQTPLEEKLDEGFEDGMLQTSKKERNDRTLSLSQLTYGKGIS